MMVRNQCLAGLEMNSVVLFSFVEVVLDENLIVQTQSVATAKAASMCFQMLRVCTGTSFQLGMLKPDPLRFY